MSFELIDANATSATWKIFGKPLAGFVNMGPEQFAQLPAGPLKDVLLTPDVTDLEQAIEILAAAGFQSYLSGVGAGPYGGGRPEYGMCSTYISVDGTNITVGAYIVAVGDDPFDPTVPCLSYTISVAYSASE